MRLYLLIFLLAVMSLTNAQAKTLTHYMKTRIGFFDACSQTFAYKFTQNGRYDVKTTVKTTGTFGVVYPFKATYHAYGSFNNTKFMPENYFYETDSFRHRTKEIVYKNGVPQYRISVKGDNKRQDDITIDEKYKTSNDLLTTFAELTYLVMQNKKCDFTQFSFNGKKYSKLTSVSEGKENIKTPYFEGEAEKCELSLQIVDDTEAGFFFDKDETVSFWVMKDKKSGLPFVAKVFLDSTPLGELESFTTKIEVNYDK